MNLRLGACSRDLRPAFSIVQHQLIGCYDISRADRWTSICLVQAALVRPGTIKAAAVGGFPSAHPGEASEGWYVVCLCGLFHVTLSEQGQTMFPTVVDRVPDETSVAVNDQSVVKRKRTFHALSNLAQVRLRAALQSSMVSGTSSGRLKQMPRLLLSSVWPWE